MSGGTPAALPGPNDTIWVSGAAVTSPLGGSLSVSNLTVDAGTTATFRIGSTAGATLTIGAGGITKLVSSQKLELSCNLALSANQVWTNAGNNIQLDSSCALSFNGYTLTINGGGAFDCRTSIQCGTNLNIQCPSADMNFAAGDFNLGSGSNSFKTFTLSAGTVEGNSFPADTNATTTSAFGNCANGTGAIALNNDNGTIIYNGNTAATPEKITIGATGTNAINITRSGQTLTLSNLYYGSGSSQPNNIYLNFGGAGNLTPPSRRFQRPQFVLFLWHQQDRERQAHSGRHEHLWLEHPGQRRHGVPRRDWGYFAGDADAPAARVAGARL